MNRDARELIRQYRESEWRTTRLAVLRQLGEFHDSRSFLFLTQIVQNGDDLAEQQIAISALAHRKGVSSRAFLHAFYPVAPDTLKASAAQALGEVRDLASVPQLIQDVDLAIARQDFAWLRNLFLSLGEMKAFSALPRMLGFLQDRGQHPGHELLLAAVFALGRLSRHPLELQNALSLHWSRIQDDALLSLVYQSALSQVQVRSQFKLEDYLNKIFTLQDPHPVLPLELLSYDPEEVDLGLSLFSMDQEWRRILFALRGVLPTHREKHVLAIAEHLQHQGNAEFWFEFFDSLRELGMTSETKSALEKILHPQGLQPELRLKWLEVDGSFDQDAPFFLHHSQEELSIRWINGWNEDSNGKLLLGQRDRIAAQLESWIQGDLKVGVQGRFIRAAAELGLTIPSIQSGLEKGFSNPALRSSLLLYLEKNADAFSASLVAGLFKSLTSDESDALALRILNVLEVYAESQKWIPDFEVVIKNFQNHFNLDVRIAVIRVLAHAKIQETWLIEQLKHQQESVVLNAIIALKSFPSSAESGDSLIPFLGHRSEVIRGRALDALCEHATLKAKQAVMKYLEMNLADDDVVDKIYRCFDPQNKGGEAFVKQLEMILNQNPDLSQWEKLVQLKERLQSHTPSLAAASMVAVIGQDALRELDLKLVEMIPRFSKLDPTVQSALRAAEQPFQQSADLQNLPVDKAPTVLEYCKALDLILDRHLGQKHLFPKLDQNLHQFQTLWHHLGFSEDYPPADKVLNALGLKGKITPENFPLHKSKMMCATFFNGKITQDRFKIFDGLRSWAVIFLLFTRKIPSAPGTPLLSIGKGVDSAVLNEQCIQIAKKLMTLQDLRNPAAHRQTYTELQLVKQVRNEAIQLVNTVLGLVL
jgi:hypothetical protein